MARIDVANTDRLREIVDEHGWPGRSLVGEEGAEHAWLVAQHATMQLDFQRRVLERLTAAVAWGEATPRQLAYLTDRVRMLEGKEQIYGTQYIRSEDGHRMPYPIEDAAHVDERRADVGLAPLGECHSSLRVHSPTSRRANSSGRSTSPRPAPSPRTRRRTRTIRRSLRPERPKRTRVRQPRLVRTDHLRVSRS